MVLFTNEARVLRFMLGAILSTRFRFWFWGIRFRFAFALFLPLRGFVCRIGLNGTHFRSFTRIGRGRISRSIFGRIRLLLPIRRFLRILRYRTNDTIHRRGGQSLRGSGPWSIRSDIIKRARLRIYKIQILGTRNGLFLRHTRSHRNILGDFFHEGGGEPVS